MLRRSVALLALATAACFNDQGVDPSGTAGGPVPSTSESPDPTGAASTGPEPTGTTAEPTTTTTTSTSTTTTTDETTAAPACDDPQCEPGDMRDGASCGICSVARELCGQDCKWAAAGCVDTGTCGHWTYDEQVGWQEQHPPPSEHAPQGPVTAAFDLPADQRVIALTADRYHVLANGAWIASGDLAALFPATKGAVQQAMTTPGEGFHYVTVVATQVAQIYILYPGALKPELFDQQPCCTSWTDSLSPPSLAAVRDVFIDFDNTPSWTDLDPNALCGSEFPAPFPYGAWLTADTVYVQDGYCNQMAYALPYAAFPPFAAPGAPPGAEVGGATLLGNRLYVFPGD